MPALDWHWTGTGLALALAAQRSAASLCSSLAAAAAAIPRTQACQARRLQRGGLMMDRTWIAAALLSLCVARVLSRVLVVLHDS